MLITDQISCFAPNPLIGANIEELGTRFPDMSHVYDLGLQEIIKTAAREQHVFLQQGVYAQLTGPSFETPAEIRMLRTLGCDAVGMSTAVEAVAAAHGYADLRHFLRVQSGGGYDRQSLEPQGSTGGGRQGGACV